jgi:predicted PurR-regulated permease PerM
VKQSSTEVGGRLLGIGSTVLAGGHAILGQILTVMLLLFFLLASSESLLRRLVEILPHFDDKRRVVSIVSDIESDVRGRLKKLGLVSFCRRPAARGFTSSSRWPLRRLG